MLEHIKRTTMPVPFRTIRRHLIRREGRPQVLLHRKAADLPRFQHAQLIPDPGPLIPSCATLMTGWSEAAGAGRALQRRSRATGRAVAAGSAPEGEAGSMPGFDDLVAVI